MRPRITLVTLGVGDLPRAVAFYREGLGWQSKGILGAGDEEGGVQDPDGHLWEVAHNPGFDSLG